MKNQLNLGHYFRLGLIEPGRLQTAAQILATDLAPGLQSLEALAFGVALRDTKKATQEGKGSP